MSIELDEESYIVGIWYSRNTKNNDNWLGCIIKDPDNLELYKGWYRYRYYKDKKIFGSDDQKNWTKFILQEKNLKEYPIQHERENYIINVMETLQCIIDNEYPEKDRVIVKGNIKDLIKLSKGKHWINFRELEL